MRESRLTPKQWVRVIIIASILSVVISTAVSVFLGLQETTIQIYHTNDVHGYAVESLDDDGIPEHIGYARVKSYIDSQPVENKLIIDAGDVLHGQSFATITKGESMARLVQAMGTDAMVPGNHDFDYGYTRLVELKEQYDLPILSENIKKDGSNLFDGYMVKKFGRVKVGIFGLTTPQTPTQTSPKNVEGISFGTPQEIMLTAADRVYALKKQKCDVIIAVMHMGDEAYLDPNSVQLAELLPDIDIIIDGHSHSVLENNRVGSTFIASTGEYMENLGVITIELKGKRVQTINADLIPAADFKDVEPDAQITALLEEINADIQPILDEVVVTCAEHLEGEREKVRSSSTNLSRMVAESMRLETGADIAITNGGGIRASIEPGPVTKGQIITVLPYGNMVMKIEATGAEIKETLNNVMIIGEGSFPQFTGMTVEAAPKTFKDADGTEYKGYEVKRILVNGEEMDPNKTYSVAINDFIFAGGDNYNTLVDGKTANEFGSMDEVLIAYMAFPDAVELVRENNFIVVE